MAPEDQLACTETLYLPSWIGDRRTDRPIASRYTRMMVNEAFKTARMDRPETLRLTDLARQKIGAGEIAHELSRHDIPVRRKARKLGLLVSKRTNGSQLRGN